MVPILRPTRLFRAFSRQRVVRRSGMLACQRGGWLIIKSVPVLLIIKSVRVLLLAVAMMPIGVMRRCVRACLCERGSVRCVQASHLTLPRRAQSYLPWYSSKHFLFRVSLETFGLSRPNPFFPKSQVEPVQFFGSGSTRFFRKKMFFWKNMYETVPMGCG